MSKQKHIVSAADKLTSRELEVLSLIGEGKTNAEIGRALNCAEGTVKKHCTHIYRKLNARNRISALNRLFEIKN